MSSGHIHLLVLDESGYNEIRNPRSKNVLIDHQKLLELTGFATYDAFWRAQQGLAIDSLANGNSSRQAQWSESIAVGSKNFLEGVKDKLGILAKGRKIMENDGVLQLRKEAGAYNTVFDDKKEDIEPLNAYFWDVIPWISAS